MRTTLLWLLVLARPAAATAQAPADSLPTVTQAFDFYTRGPYRPAVPRPEAITGYTAGLQQTMYAVMQHYLDTIATAAPERGRSSRIRARDGSCCSSPIPCSGASGVGPRGW
jgi:hypothetical protein